METDPLQDFISKGYTLDAYSPYHQIPCILCIYRIDRVLKRGKRFKLPKTISHDSTAGVLVFRLQSEK